MKTLGIYALLMLPASFSAAAQADGLANHIAQHPPQTERLPADTSRIHVIQDNFVPIVTSRTAVSRADIAVAGRAALDTADSLVQAFREERWSDYLELSYPGVVDYYGGKKGFLESLRRTRPIAREAAEQPITLELLQLHHQDNEWQCVVRKTRSVRIDNRRARVISYMVGQSGDGGHHWKYVDVAYNSPENLGYIMPDIFRALVVPQRQIIFLDDSARVLP